MALEYDKQFDPEGYVAPEGEPRQHAIGDRRDGQVYIYDDDLTLVVNVAMVTGRPLLLRGPSGSGKSSVARHVARVLKRRYYEDVVSSTTQARDLLWKFDTVAQLADATAGKDLKPEEYVIPGILWWAFDNAGAARETRRTDPAIGGESDGSVVLLDEIDKADPDVPNNLLVPLGSLQFTARIGDRDVPVKAEHPPLVIITTNEERDLPPAFIRRCIAYSLKRPDRDRLLAIAREHFPNASPHVAQAIADLVIRIGDSREKAGALAPSTAEFLDAIAACAKLKVSPSSEDEVWKRVATAVLDKPRSEEAGGR
jgi:MoxR-like ATPase